MAAASALSARAGSLREAFVTSAVALVPALTKSSAEAWFKDIAKRYEEPHRAYHTMQHITGAEGWQGRSATEPQHAKWPPSTDMHGTMEGMAGIEKHDAFVLAIAFHDAVYDPQSKSNEEDSALLLLDWLDEAGVKPATFGPDLAWVVKAILRTKAHSMEDKDSPLSIAHSVFGELDEGLSGLPSQGAAWLRQYLWSALSTLPCALLRGLTSYRCLGLGGVLGRGHAGAVPAMGSIRRLRPLHSSRVRVFPGRRLPCRAQQGVAELLGQALAHGGGRASCEGSRHRSGLHLRAAGLRRWRR